MGEGAFDPEDVCVAAGNILEVLSDIAFDPEEKTADRLRALEMLSRHLAMKAEIAKGSATQILTDADRAVRIAYLLGK